MKSSLFFFALLSCLSSVRVVQSTLWKRMGSSNLLISSRKMSAEQAGEYCRAQGAHLLRFVTKSELFQLKKFFTLSSERSSKLWTDGYWNAENSQFLWSEEKSPKSASLLQELTLDLDIEKEMSCVLLVVDEHGKLSWDVDDCRQKRSFVCQEGGKPLNQVADRVTSDEQKLLPHKDGPLEESDLFPLSNDELLHFDLKESSANTSNNQFVSHFKFTESRRPTSLITKFVSVTQSPTFIEETQHHDSATATEPRLFFTLNLKKKDLLMVTIIISVAFLVLFIVITLFQCFKYNRKRHLVRYRRPCGTKNINIEETHHLNADWA